MSTTVDFLTVTHSIASLSISGVTVKDTHEVTDSLGMATAILTPNPLNLITDFAVVRDEMTGQLLTLRYTLHYIYYHCQIGAGLGGMFASYNSMLTNLALIVKAFCSDATLSGAIDNTEPQIGQIAAIPDGAGNLYHSCEIAITVSQFLEV